MEESKTKIVVATDTHIGSCGHAEMDDYVDLINLDRRLEKKKTPMFLTGDIVDITNCKKKKVSFYREVIKRLRSHFGSRYTIGNHCAMNIGTGFVTYMLRSGKMVCFAHGTGVYIEGTYYPIHYSEKSTKKWARKKGGRGKWSAWKYKMWRKFSKHKGGWKEPSDKVKANIAKICKLLGCDIFVWGHTHKMYRGVHNGILLLNLQKGIHTIYV